MRKILIANRGEIAARLILACRERGYATVAVYAEPDAEDPYVFLADEALPLPGATPQETYLQGERLIALALEAGCDAVHPGYGFLSENAAFAARCAEAGLTFIGPGPKAIALLGHKRRARDLMQQAGVPVLPGGVLSADPASHPRPGDYPVMVKAAGGGGGMGLRRVEAPEQLADAIAEARAQCEAAFAGAKHDEVESAGSAEDPLELYWETYAEGGRHIEVQIAADHHGAVAALGERECSIQRRFQKIIEECPSPALSDDERARLAEWAVAAARSVGYANVGTVEFLWTPERGATFMEMNTRLQVEHPVTECVYGLDLPVAQLRLAAGEPLADVLAGAQPRGCALEARLYAEDPVTGAPAPGRIDHVAWPTGPWVRVDAGIEAPATLSPHFDALLAKIVAWGPDRETARRRLADALARTAIAGTLTTNLPLLRAILDETDFVQGRFDTRYMTTHHPEQPDVPLALAASGYHAAHRTARTEVAIAGASSASARDWAARRWR